jgi:alkylhydroperoxidase/carboxymuconolactone decarboxylase family protein YurZ
MASVKLISENEAEGKVREIYEEIMTTLGIDFVPNMYKAMAKKPAFLESNWRKVEAVMVEPGRLDRMTKEIIAVSVSAVMGCRY